MPEAKPPLPVPRRLPASALALAWRQTRRDLAAGELRLLLVAVVLAVAALTAVGFFADRLQGGLTRDAAQLLGGDALVASDQPTAASVLDAARRQGLRAAVSAAFPSMARAPDAQGGATRLVSVKAVEDGYPLRGRITLADAQGQRGETVAHGPAAGTVWVDIGVLDALGLKRGDTLLLGDAALRIAEVIALEPDRGAGFLSFAPRVMLHRADLDNTGLVQPASRITWRLAVAAADGQRDGPARVAAFVQEAERLIEQQPLRGVRVESLESGRPEMRQTLDRARKFLDLVALLAALLAAVAVAVASRDFALRHLDGCAMLRVLGAPQRTIARAYALEFGAIGLAASAIGVVVGWGLHHVFVALLGSLVSVDLPAAGPRPALFGFGVGLALLFGFGLAPVLQLARVPALRVLRRDVGTPRPASVGVQAAGLAGFAALLLASSADLYLGLIAVGGFAGALLAFALLAWGAVLLLKRLVPERGAPRWLVLATRQVAARPGFAVLQVSALAVGLLALVLLVLLRTDLIRSWRQTTPADAPDRFVINIQPDQAQAYRAALQAAGVQGDDWYPMIRGRLVAVNGRAVSSQDYAEDRARRLVDREFNLSHTDRLPPHNALVAGRWQPEESDGLSVEEGLATTLGLKLGDRLRFDIAGQTAEARVTSLRSVEWGSMHVNFFVLFPRASMPQMPLTYISAFRAPPQANALDRRLGREFPNLTVVDVSASIAQLQSVLDQVVRAVEFLFVFTLAAGLVVLFAALGATREARSREYAVMRALGASGALLRRVQGAELLGTGLLAGTLAAVAASIVGWALARRAFEFEWAPSPWVPLAGALAGAVLALLAGWWGLRGVLSRPVVQTLREAS